MSTTAPEQQQNPLEEGLMLRRKPEPCVLVIFGASGDLAHKKLMPALYSLMVRRLMPPRFASRDEIKFSARVAAALRQQFGGHAIRALERAKAGEDPR